MSSGYFFFFIFLIIDSRTGTLPIQMEWFVIYTLEISCRRDHRIGNSWNETFPGLNWPSTSFSCFSFNFVDLHSPGFQKNLRLYQTSWNVFKNLAYFWMVCKNLICKIQLPVEFKWIFKFISFSIKAKWDDTTHF